MAEFRKTVARRGASNAGQKRYTNMTSTRPAGPTFRAGDEVVLTQGTYPGTLGVFLRLKEDVNWADITERNGNVRSHPVTWLAHSATATRPAAGISPAPERTALW